MDMNGDNNKVNIYDRCEAMGVLFDEHAAQLARIFGTLDYLHSLPIPITSGAETEALALAYVAAFELCLLRVREVRERLVTVRPVIWANRRHLLREQMREVERHCDCLSMNLSAINDRLGAAPTQKRMQVRSALEDLHQQMETMMRDIATKTSPGEFRNQVQLFSASHFYQTRRSEFLARVMAEVVDECVREGAVLTELRRYEAFRRMLWRHPVYGPILQAFPGIYVNETYRASAIQEMLRPREGEDSHGIGHWMDLLTAVQLNKERSDLAAALVCKREEEKAGRETAADAAGTAAAGRIEEGCIVAAVRRLQEEGLLVRAYDHAWVMEAMNGERDMPSFTVATDYIDLLDTQGFAPLPSKAQLNRYRSQVRGRLPRWEFSDSAGQNAKERERRIALAQTFVEWARGDRR